jgi:hypothetical protein
VQLETKVDGVQHGGKHRGASEQGCTGVHRVNNGMGGVRRGQRSDAYGRVSLAWAYHSPTNVHIYSLVAEHISCSVMSLLV